MARALARRYARALADILFEAKLAEARKQKEVQSVKQQLAEFAALLSGHAGLRNVLANPAVSKEQKLALLDRLRGALKWSELTRNFLAVLAENRRLNQLDAVVQAFDEEVYARLGIVPVEVTTAAELSDTQKKLLEERLAALTGSAVELRFQQDPEILAGVVARLGGTIYDGSVKAHLRRMQAQLTCEAVPVAGATGLGAKGLG